MVDKKDNRRTYSVHRNDEEFRDVINHLIKKHDIKEIVETGAFVGMGSTTVFGKTGLLTYSIECNPNHYEVAKHKTRFYPNVFIFHGLSLTRKELIKAVVDDDYLDNPPEGIQTDSPNPKPYYLAEIMKPVQEEDLLSLLTFNSRKQLIFLDSAGAVGFAEFNHIMNYPDHFRKNKILVLDDVQHVKHARSVEYLEKAGFKPIISDSGTFAWANLNNKNE